MADNLNELEQERIWIEQSKEDLAFFRPIYEKYSEALFRYFVRRTDDFELAQDLSSLTFEKAIDKLNSFQWQGKPFGAWLFKIAGNVLRKHFRDSKPIFVIELDKLNCIPQNETTEQPDFVKHLVEELDGLSESDLQLLELKYFEKLSFKEMSELIGIGESAAKMRVYRLLNLLKTKLEHHDQA